MVSDSMTGLKSSYVFHESYEDICAVNGKRLDDRLEEFFVRLVSLMETFA